MTGGSDGLVRVWDLTGQLMKSFGSDWRPKNAQDAARSAVLCCEGLDVRFLTPEEEKNLGIDAAVPLEEESLADSWRAALATTRNFTMLEDQPELRPEEVKQRDLLAGWLSSHQQSSADRGTQVRAQVATDLHKTLLSTSRQNTRGRESTLFGTATRNAQLISSIRSWKIFRRTPTWICLRCEALPAISPATSPARRKIAKAV